MYSLNTAPRSEVFRDRKFGAFQQLKYAAAFAVSLKQLTTPAIRHGNVSRTACNTRCNASPSESTDFQTSCPKHSRMWSADFGSHSRSSLSSLAIQTFQEVSTVVSPEPGQSPPGSRPKLSSLQLRTAVQAIILAGGPSGNPLAKHRAMPAVPFGANLLLIDVPINNCIASGVSKIYVLTQFNSHSLNTYIAQAYPPLGFGGNGASAFVDVLACNQTPDSMDWYRGSAEAVARNFDSFLDPLRGGDVVEDFLILCGQAVYRMDLEDFITQHRRSGADISIATYAVDAAHAKQMGVIKADPVTGLVLEFMEKPTEDTLGEFAMVSHFATADAPYEASMGIYAFRREAMLQLLEPQAGQPPATHFGHDVIPAALNSGLRVLAVHNRGYWKDVSSLRDFHSTSLSLALPDSPIRMHEVDSSVVSSRLALPPAKITNCMLDNILLGDGAVIRGSSLKNVVVGCNTFIAPGCDISNTVIMGNSIFQNDWLRQMSLEAGQAVLGVGPNTIIRNAMIDKDASVGANVRIVNQDGVQEADREASDGFVISDGIVVVMKDAVVKDGTVI